ncbi:hypothetical protein Anapl_17787 [Anas platyrhynchos]|uniref:Uncharacterized protein n=1 Tax=Anas platyrhynchos TaxID=8839 RepID=R0LXN5_ANAPL|nr:hypothetical protein Anapl_17787 [Anas platyrhynchos]
MQDSALITSVFLYDVSLYSLGKSCFFMPLHEELLLVLLLLKITPQIFFVITSTLHRDFAELPVFQYCCTISSIVAREHLLLDDEAMKTSMWLADLKQAVVPECLLGDVSGVLAGFTRESEIKPCAPGKVTYICEKSSVVTKVKEIIVLIRLKRGKKDYSGIIPNVPESFGMYVKSRGATESPNAKGTHLKYWMIPKTGTFAMFSKSSSLQEVDKVPFLCPQYKRKIKPSFVEAKWMDGKEWLSSGSSRKSQKPGSMFLFH